MHYLNSLVTDPDSDDTLPVSIPIEMEIEVTILYVDQEDLYETTKSFINNMDLSRIKDMKDATERDAGRDRRPSKIGRRVREGYEWRGMDFTMSDQVYNEHEGKGGRGGRGGREAGGEGERQGGREGGREGGGGGGEGEGGREEGEGRDGGREGREGGGGERRGGRGGKRRGGRREGGRGGREGGGKGGDHLTSSNIDLL